MSFATTSGVQLAYIEEASFGVTPAVGNPKALRITGETFNYDITKEQSDEINMTRSVSSVVPVGASAGGGLSGEMQYAEYDPLLEATLQGSFVAYGTNGVGSTFTADFTATDITAAVAPTGNNAFTVLKRGQWFRVNAPGDANDKKFLRVSKTVAPTSTVITLDPSTPAVVSSAVADVSLASRRLTNGVNQRSFTFERQQTEIGAYMAFRGMTLGSLSLAIQSAARTTVSFEAMGRDMVVSDTATTLPGTMVPSQNYDIHSSVSGLDCKMWIDGPASGAFVKSLTWDYDNSMRAQDAICTLGSVGIGSGQIVTSLTAQLYFPDVSLFEKFLANDYPEVVFSTLDPLGNGYFITLPRANISSVSTSASGKDQDMMLDVTFTCVRDAGNADATLRQLVFVDAVGAAVS